ncbi:hypothetical protein ABIB48_001519 [Arthrobacter sp. UYCu511]
MDPIFFIPFGVTFLIAIGTAFWIYRKYEKK